MEADVPFTPVNFFQIEADCKKLPSEKKEGFGITKKNYARYLLPDTSALLGEKHFAEVSLAFGVSGIECFVLVSQPFQSSNYPQIERGDSMEVCIDTRNIKTSGYNTKFCHHFFCLPEAVDGHQAGEMTRFRTEDAHDLCNPDDLLVKSELYSNSYGLWLFIPSHCLHGYDPEQHRKIGFTYRINRSRGVPQHFSVSSEDYQFAQQPALWSSVQLIF